METYRIVYKNYGSHNISGDYSVEIKNKSIFGDKWETLYSSYEEYKDNKVINKKFETFESAERYFLSKHVESRSVYYKRSANVYEVSEFSMYY